LTRVAATTAILLVVTAVSAVEPAPAPPRFSLELIHRSEVRTSLTADADVQEMHRSLRFTVKNRNRRDGGRELQIRLLSIQARTRSGTEVVAFDSTREAAGDMLRPFSILLRAAVGREYSLAVSPRDELESIGGVTNVIESLTRVDPRFGSEALTVLLHNIYLHLAVPSRPAGELKPGKSWPCGQDIRLPGCDRLRCAGTCKVKSAKTDNRILIENDGVIRLRPVAGKQHTARPAKIVDSAIHTRIQLDPARRLPVETRLDLRFTIARETTLAGAGKMLSVTTRVEQQGRLTREPRKGGDE
jgi:hypothetical protein